MKEIKKLENQINQFGQNFELLKYEISNLKAQIEDLKIKNEILVKKNQDMLLQIDQVLNINTNE
jgi:predicted RNase H-like nuclease (RuvC/YqgF family)